MPDQIAVDAYGDMYVTGLQHALKWQAFVENAKNKSPFLTVKVSINTNEDKFYGKKVLKVNCQFNNKTVVGDDGNAYNGATCGIPFKDKLYIAGPLSEGVLVCSIEGGNRGESDLKHVFEDELDEGNEKEEL